jgi:RNA polymerase sigma factor (sigma-70 family)
MSETHRTGRSSKYYGKLMTAQLPSEIKAIWYSRDEELPELPRHGWSWELQTDMTDVENRELVTKLLEATPLTERQELVIRMVVLESETLRDVGQELGLSTQRVRTIYNEAMRKLRFRQKDFTGQFFWLFECGITTWQAFRRINRELG